MADYELTRPNRDHLPDRLRDELRQKVRVAAEGARGRGTRRVYQTQWRLYEEWVTANKLPIASPETVAAYFVSMAEAGKSWWTISTARNALTLAFRYKGAKVRSNPESDAVLPTRHELVAEVLKGLRRKMPETREQVDPIMPELLRRLCDWWEASGNRYQLRNRALLLVGWRTALRRSELIALDGHHVQIRSDRMIVTVAQHWVDGEIEPGDKTGEGGRIPVAWQGGRYCAVEAVRALLRDRDEAPGPLFQTDWGRMTPQSVNLVIKKAVAGVGEDPSRFGAHSLRAGFVTAAITAGKSVHEIKKQTRHKSLKILDRYYRDLEAGIREDAGKGLV